MGSHLTSLKKALKKPWHPESGLLGIKTEECSMEKLRPQRTWQPGVGGSLGWSGLKWSQSSEGLRHCILGPCLPLWGSGLWP